MLQGTKRKRTHEGGSNDTIEDNTHQELIDMTSPTSTITSKTNQIGVGTLINNLQPPNVVVTDNSSASCWSGLTTAKGEYLYKAQEGSFEETMYQFMKRCMGYKPFCCDKEDGMDIVKHALKKNLVVCPVEMTTKDFHHRLVKICLQANKKCRTAAQSAIKGKYDST